MKKLIEKFMTWFRGLTQDPDGSPSSTRVCGVACYVAAFALAGAGMAMNREQAPTVTALLVGGAAALGLRRRSTDTDSSGGAA